MTALLAKDKIQAVKLVAELTKKCRDGVSDEETAALGIGAAWGLDLDEIRKGFADSRKLITGRWTVRGLFIADRLLREERATRGT